MSLAPRPLPPGFISLGLLARSPDGEVHRARGPRGEVALRLTSPRAGAPGRAELAVLAAVDHPGLARLVDFGRLPDSGDSWLARTWIEGSDLRRWAAGRSGEELGGLLARLCPALQYLHERGFVHADIKPENVLVDARGEPHLTDFGLSLRRGEGSDTAGSLFYVAPEVLGGGRLDVAADLFALGVLLHALLLAPDVRAQEFYARFPREDYFQATGTRASQLPGWARGIVAQLLERDPARRPPSAAVVESTLRARLGLAPGKQVDDLRRRVLRWSPLEGREDWLLGLALETQRALLLHLPPGEDAREFAAALRLWLSLRGESAALVDPPSESGAVEDLDAVTQAVLERAGDGLLLFPIDPDEHDGWRRFEYLLRCAEQARRGAASRVPRIVGLSEARAPLACPVEATREVPLLELSTLAALLRRELSGDVESLAAQLHGASAGAVATARRRLQRGFARGDVVHGAQRPRLAPGARPDLWADEPSLFEQGAPSSAELELLAALEVCSGRAELEELHGLVGLDETTFSAALGSCLRSDLLRWSRELGQLPQVVLVRPLEERVFAELGLGRVQAMYARRAEDLDARDLDEGGHAPLQAALAGYAARPSLEGLAGVLAALQRLNEAWRPGAALDVAQRLEKLARRFAPAQSSRATSEVAVAWARLGQLERAEELLADLERESAAQASTLATIERARGVIAHERHDYESAAAHLEKARELQPDDGGESRVRQVVLAWDRRAEAELDALYSAALSEAPGMSSAVRWSLDALRGTSLVRRGRLDEGLALLEGQLSAAIEAGDPAREAKARLNLATALRRSGGAERAISHLRRAARIQEQANHVPDLAQVRATLGGTLRTQGQLHEAEQNLRSACELRERLGDESGATAARGMLGLVHADRGHLRAALDELGASARQLRAARRSADALLLEARGLEVEARLAAEAPRGLASEEPAADPRVLISHARAQALWGRNERAADFAQRALALARKLGLEATIGEAAFLLSCLGADAPAAVPDSHAPARTAAERQAWLHVQRSADELEFGPLLETARSLASRGFADLAARLALRALAQADSDQDGNVALILARDWLEEVELGLTEEQAHRARRTLLGLPDPQPRDIDGFERALAEGGVLDMDVISLLDINRRLVSQDDLVTLLGEIVESALSVTHAERGFLVLERDGEFEFDTARHSRRGNIPDPELEVSRSVLRRVFESGATLRLSNAGDDPLLSAAPSVEHLDLHSILVTPFTVDEELRGVIYVDHRLKEGAFSARAERMLELLAGQAALAIRQVRRLEEIRSLNGELNRRVRDREAELARARRALEEAGAKLPVGELVGSSAAMRSVHAMIERAAPSNLPVLVCGASGTGKELAARALHRLSARAEGPFVVENCAALPASLIESELFGYKKGAFTGADRDRAGIFERADGGTLFLDEIGELPIELQAKLLRVLETGEVRRVGGSEPVHTDFRLVAATNRDLQAEVAGKRFRADLMYRLDALRIEMPELAQRVEDIPELVQHFMGREEAASGLRREVSRPVLAALSRRDWPGNVRELANEVARLCVLSAGDLEDPDLLRPPAPRADAEPSGGFEAGAEVLPIAELERRAILHALRRTGGDKRQAADLLGISRAKLYGRLKAWTEEESAS